MWTLFTALYWCRLLPECSLHHVIPNAVSSVLWSEHLTQGISTTCFPRWHHHDDSRIEIDRRNPEICPEIGIFRVVGSCDVCSKRLWTILNSTQRPTTLRMPTTTHVITEAVRCVHDCQCSNTVTPTKHISRPERQGTLNRSHSLHDGRYDSK